MLHTLQKILRHSRIILLTLALLAFAAGTACAAPSRTIKVGYFAFEGYHAMDEEGNRSGCGYDFLMLLRRYADLNFEYVGYDKSWQEMLVMLERGEIELLTAAYRSPEREERFDFSLPIGTDSIRLNVREQESRYVPGDYSTFNGMTVGLLEGSRSNQHMAQFAQENGFSYSPRYYPAAEQLAQALARGEVDAVASSSLRRTKQEKTLAEFDTEYFCAMVKKGNRELLAAVNNAIVQMNRVEGNWQSSLYYKNYDAYNNADLVFTPEEQAYIKEHSQGGKKIVIAYDNKWAPFTYKKNGQYTGILPDYWEAVMRLTGMQFESYDSGNDIIDERELLAGKADIYLGYCFDAAVSEKNGFVESVPILNVGACYLTRKGTTAIKKVGVSKINPRLNSLLVLGADQQLVEFASSEEALVALENGEIDEAFLYAYEGEMLVNRDKTGLLVYRLNPQKNVSLCAIIPENGSHVLIGIVSKCIKSLSPAEVNTIIAKNLTVDMQKLSAMDYIALHPLLGMGGAAALIALLGVVGLMWERRRVELEHNTALQEKINEISVLNAGLKQHEQELHESNCEKQAQLQEIIALNEILRDRQAELEAAKQEAEGANEAKTSFLFNMSHDIRTPMNAIVGFTDLALKHREDRARLLDYLEKIKDSGAVLLSIINNVLEMARIEKGAVSLDEQVWEAGKGCEIVYVMFQELMAKKNITFTRTVKVQQRYIMCDDVKLREILLNLVSNAYKYTNSGGSVQLQLEELPCDREGYILLQSTVSDTGIGMSEEFLPKLFAEFSREHTMTENKVEGTGLGMPIVKRLVELMGGTITVTSRQGEGTTFVVTIPHRLVTEAELPKQVQTVEEMNFAGCRLLLAEDNDLNAEIATELLQEAGFTVERAVDGRECFEMICDREPGYYRAVLMDIQMPELDGYGATLLIRKLEDKAKAELPILAMTANAFAEDKRRAVETGMNGHVAKPIDVQELLSELARVLQG